MGISKTQDKHSWDTQMLVLCGDWTQDKLCKWVWIGDLSHSTIFDLGQIWLRKLDFPYFIILPSYLTVIADTILYFHWCHRNQYSWLFKIYTKTESLSTIKIIKSQSLRPITNLHRKLNIRKSISHLIPVIIRYN